MKNIIKYAAINTKIGVLERSLLSKDDYNNLILKKTPEEVFNYLNKNTRYKEIINLLNGEEATLMNFEVVLKQDIINRLFKIKHYFSGDYKKFFQIMLLRYEIEDIKRIIRGLNSLEKKRSNTEKSGHKNYYSSIDFDRIEKAENLEAFIELLKDTIYYNLLKPFIKEDINRRGFYMEMTLDRVYFKKLSEHLSKLNSKDAEIISVILGKNIDLLNIQWIYRGLNHYELSAEELLNYTLLNGFRFKYKEIRKLCYLGFKEFIKEILKTEYYFLFSNEDEFKIIIEKSTDRYLNNIFESYLKKEKMDIVKSMGYLHRIEFESKDIFSILEGINYKLEPTYIKKFLIRNMEYSFEKTKVK